MYRMLFKVFLSIFDNIKPGMIYRFFQYVLEVIRRVEISCGFFIWVIDERQNVSMRNFIVIL